MAKVHVWRIYPDGDRIQCTVEADDTYPDALDQARAVAVRGFKEAIGASESTWTEPQVD